jgi:hypothetical protein
MIRRDHLQFPAVRVGLEQQLWAGLLLGEQQERLWLQMMVRVCVMILVALLLSWLLEQVQTLPPLWRLHLLKGREIWEKVMKRRVMMNGIDWINDVLRKCSSPQSIGYNCTGSLGKHRFAC